MMFSLAARLQRMQRRLLEVMGPDLRTQVQDLLLDETGGLAGSINLTQSTIAQLLGASRQGVNRVLRDLEAEGVVRLAWAGSTGSIPMY
jgi:CRP-like cAMP-binding protein